MNETLILKGIMGIGCCWVVRLGSSDKVQNHEWFLPTEGYRSGVGRWTPAFFIWSIFVCRATCCGRTSIALS